MSSFQASQSLVRNSLCAMAVHGNIMPLHIHNVKTLIKQWNIPPTPLPAAENKLLHSHSAKNANKNKTETTGVHVKAFNVHSTPTLTSHLHLNGF